MTRSAEMGAMWACEPRYMGSSQKLEKYGNRFSPRSSRRRSVLLTFVSLLTPRTSRQYICAYVPSTVCWQRCKNKEPQLFTSLQGAASGWVAGGDRCVHGQGSQSTIMVGLVPQLLNLLDSRSCNVRSDQGPQRALVM